MSRGLGRVERAIREHIMSHWRSHLELQQQNRENIEAVLEAGRILQQDVDRLGIAELKAQPYFANSRFLAGDTYPLPRSRAQRQAIVRAMHSFVRKFPRYGLTGGVGRGSLYVYDRNDEERALAAIQESEKKRRRQNRNIRRQNLRRGIRD